MALVNWPNSLAEVMMILVDGHQLLAGVKWWLWSIGTSFWLE